MLRMQANLPQTCQTLSQYSQGSSTSFLPDAERLKDISLRALGTFGIVMGNYGVGWFGKLWRDESGTVERKGAADEMRRRNCGCGDFGGKENGNCAKEFRSGLKMPVTIQLYALVKVIEYAFSAASSCSANVR